MERKSTEENEGSQESAGQRHVGVWDRRRELQKRMRETERERGCTGSTTAGGKAGKRSQHVASGAHTQTHPGKLLKTEGGEKILNSAWGKHVLSRTVRQSTANFSETRDQRAAGWHIQELNGGGKPCLTLNSISTNSPPEIKVRIPG